MHMPSINILVNALKMGENYILFVGLYLLLFTNDFCRSKQVKVLDYEYQVVF